MMELTQEIEALCTAEITGSHVVQELWSGYGEIRRVFLKGGDCPSVIVKDIQYPVAKNHPRGWNTQQSHERKLRSYQVEARWYQHYAHRTDDSCRVPKVMKVINETSRIVLVMEDLDGSGYDLRFHPGSISLSGAKSCLTWLAGFHGRFLRAVADGLWSVGTYWHLATRPDEYERMENQPLKAAAEAIDRRLNAAKFQTFVHGDAKLANFCFAQNEDVAAVDFQYVGQGCGMKDVVYFMSSCFEEKALVEHERSLLDYYFEQLQVTVDKSIDFQLLKEEWKGLYKYAWADFYRFLDGWSPGHWKMHGVSERQTREVMKELKSTEC